MNCSTKRARIISKCFEIRVVIGGRAFGSAWGPAKKQAEQRAARIALEELGVLKPGDDHIAELEDLGESAEDAGDETVE